MKYAISREEKSSEKSIDLDAVVEQPRWNLSEITLSDKVVNQIEEIVAYVNNREKLLNDWHFSRFLKAGSGLSINFFGLALS